MEVTKVNLVKLNENDKRFKGVVAITLDNEFVIHNIKIIETEKGKLVCMPSENINGTYKDIAHPITKEARDKIVKAILDEYNK